jgi:sugar phosphate isomerase/epimerase
MNEFNPPRTPTASKPGVPSQGELLFGDRSLGCSSLSFRKDSIADALDAIIRLGFAEFDLGIYPGYCEHYDALRPSQDGRSRFVDRIKALGLVTRTLNVRPGSFSGSRAESGQLWAVLQEEVTLAAALGAIGVSMATGEPRPGMDRAESIQMEADGFRRLAALAADSGLICLVEAPHFGRVCDTVDTATRLIDAIDHPAAFLTLDTSHIAAAGADLGAVARSLGPRARHVQLRDARPGYAQLPIGQGIADFGAFFRGLAGVKYEGHFALELATEESTVRKEEEVDQARRLVLSYWGARVSLDQPRPEPQVG